MIPLIEVVRIRPGYEGWVVRMIFGDGRTKASVTATEPMSENSTLCAAFGVLPRVAWPIFRAHVEAFARAGA